MTKRFGSLLWTPVAVTFTATLLAGGPAHAACCRVVKVDDEIATLAVRVCENDGEAGCGAELYVGPLPLGASQQVCPATDTLVYEEWDELVSGFGAPVVAPCAGQDVEL